MNFSKKLFMLMASTILLVFLLAACAGDPDDEETEGTDENATEGEKGGDLVIATVSDAVTLDPNGSNDLQSYDVQSNIFETLVKHDENLELQPGLAESWESIEDDLWEFKLQEGVTFHDGSEFNADVVKANIDRLLDPKVASTEASLFEVITNIEVVGDYTIQFKTEYPFALLPAQFAHSVTGMVSPELIEDDYAAMEDGNDPGSMINKDPIGTGYFKFDEWKPGNFVRLVRNDDYWDESALLDSVEFKVVKEDGTRIAEISTGDSHISDPLSPSDVEQVKQANGVDVYEQRSAALEYIGFNNQKEPFDDKRVRQAITMAIDKETIIEGIHDGYAVAANGPVPPDVPGFDDSISSLDYDIEKAKELLTEAGYEDGFSTTIWTNDGRERIDTAVNVQSQLKKIDIDVKVEELEWGAYLENTANGEHDMFVLSSTSDTGDIDNSMTPLLHSENIGKAGNRTFTENDELDELLDQGRQTLDETERFEIYSDAQEKLVDIAPMISTHYKVYLLGVRDEVKGLTRLPSSFLILKDVYIED